MKRALGFLAAFTIAVAAHAQSNAGGIASQLFDAGRDLMKRGDFASACPKLAESARLEPRVGTLARLAECEEKIGHLAAARGHWKDAAELARAQQDDRAGHAEEELKRVDATVPRLILKPQATPPGFAVKLDDVAFGLESMSLPLPIDPGHHTIVATAKDKQAWRGAVDAQADGSTTTLEIPALADVVVVVATVTPNIEQPSPTTTVTTRPLRGVAIGVGIGAAITMGIGFAFGAHAQGLRDSAVGLGCTPDGACPSQPTQAASDYNDARVFADFSTVMVIAGSVVLAGSIVLAIVAPKTVTRSALRVAPFGVGGVF
jgi:hypothetical protein